MPLKEKKSKTLARLWPEYFGNEPTEKDMLIKCLSVLENIEHRYNVRCNVAITRNQIMEIESLIAIIRTGSADR